MTRRRRRLLIGAGAGAVALLIGAQAWLDLRGPTLEEEADLMRLEMCQSAGGTLDSCLESYARP